MPREGEKFINAVGKEVVAHGGATPKNPAVRSAPRPDQAINTEVHADVFGREYDPTVPVFLPTGTNLVIDRLAMAGHSKGSPFGGLIDVDSLIELANSKGHFWNPTEHGMPPQWWLDANKIAVTPAPGYGTGTDPTAPYAPIGDPSFPPEVTGQLQMPGTLSCDTGEWYANPAPSGYAYQWLRDGADIVGETASTYTTSFVDDDQTMISCRVTATNSEGSGQAVSNAVAPVVAPPSINVQNLVVESADPTIDLAPYTKGDAVTWDATGDEVVSVVGSVLTMSTNIEVSEVQVTATNASGSDTSTFMVSVIAVNLYANPELSGGALSGPAHGSFPPDSHNIGFNTVDAYPVDNLDGTFDWRINDAQATGRSYLTYVVHDNHPTLQVGDVLAVSWEVENLRDDTARMLATSGVSNATVETPILRALPGQTTTLSAKATVLDLPFTAQIRVGVGPTNTATSNVIIKAPKAFLED